MCRPLALTQARHEKQEAAAVQRNLELKQQLHELRSSARGHAHSAQDFIKRAEVRNPVHERTVYLYA